jgi:membrane-associated phospholipid phosphatase
VTATRAARLSAPAVTGLVASVVALGPLALLVRSSWPPLVRLDAAVTDAAERAVTASPALLAAARATTHLGDPALAGVVAGGLALVLLARGHGRLALLVVAVRVGTQVLSTGTKAAVDRSRPVFEAPVDSALGASYPSGHTLAAAGLWSVIAVLLLSRVRPARRPLLLAAAVGIAVVVAASRVLLGVHHLSDVVAALALGLGWTALCTAVLVRRRAEDGVEVDRVSDAVR